MACRHQRRLWLGNTAVLHASSLALRDANAFTKERTEHAEAVARAHCARARGSGVAHGPCASCEHGEDEESEEGAAHPTRKSLAIPDATAQMGLSVALVLVGLGRSLSLPNRTVAHAKPLTSISSHTPRAPRPVLHTRLAPLVLHTHL